jgi:hypothetical protein
MTKYIVATSHGNFQVEADHYSVSPTAALVFHLKTEVITKETMMGKQAILHLLDPPLTFASWRSIYEAESGMPFSEIIIEEEPLNVAPIHTTVIVSHDPEEQAGWRAQGYRVATDKNVYAKNVVMTKYKEFKPPKYQFIDLIDALLKKDPQFVKDYCHETLQHIHDTGILREDEAPESIEALEAQGDNYEQGQAEADQQAKDDQARKAEFNEGQPPDGDEDPIY